MSEKLSQATHLTGRSGLVVVRFPMARVVPGSNLRCRLVSVLLTKITAMLWAWAAHLLQCLGRLCLPPYEER